jgi:uncharacterized spore protein YtfJ
MNDSINQVLQRAEEESQGQLRAIERLVSAADVSKVFSAPVVAGDRTVISAARVSGSGGFGSGIGLGMPHAGRRAASGETGSVSELGAEGAGGGGGGGGRSTGRPVAAIIIGPDTVEVKPILDVTKISLTALAAFGVLAVIALKKFAKR